MKVNKYKPVFKAIKKINAAGVDKTKEEFVHEFTGGITTSLRDLDDEQIKLLTRRLYALIGDPKNDAIRKGIISQFKATGRTAAHAIAWAEKFGVRGVKRGFNEYDTQELMVLLQNAKKVRADYIKAVNKRI